MNFTLYYCLLQVSCQLPGRTVSDTSVSHIPQLFSKQEVENERQLSLLSELKSCANYDADYKCFRVNGTQRAAVLTLTLHWESLTREGLRTPISHSCSALLQSCIWGNEARWSYTLDLVSKCKVLGGNEVIHTPEARIFCTIFVHYFSFSHWESVGEWFILKESKALNHDLSIIC